MLAALRHIREEPSLLLLLIFWRGAYPVIRQVEDMPPARVLLLAIVGIFLVLMICEWLRDPRGRR